MHHFASADYIAFLAIVFLLWMTLRRAHGWGALARAGVLLLLGDFAYLLLAKDPNKLCDPFGGFVFRWLADAIPIPLSDFANAPAAELSSAGRSSWDWVVTYLAGSGVLGLGLWLGYRRNRWLESSSGQALTAAAQAGFFASIGVIVYLSVTQLWPAPLPSITAIFSQYGHLLFLFGFGIALGAALLDPRGLRIGRGLVLFIASILFYHAWSANQRGAYAFVIALIVGTVVIDWYLALWIEKARTQTRRKLLLWIAIVANLGILCLFKYIDFFLGSTRWFGFDPPVFHLMLPAGISFHTFQSLSYVIDVYRKEIPATRSVFGLSTYIMFFPQLLMGPIVRAHELMPQLSRVPDYDYERASRGLYRIVVGLFKKIALADTLGVPFVTAVFEYPERFTGLEVLFGVYAYAFQIYLDFSAYSDIAIGSANVLGFKFPENFDTPYRSSNLQEFWRRWHISLSSWLRDYLYIPLGGSQRGVGRTYFNLTATMLLGGLWHGAKWNFLVWGALHGGGLAVTRVFQRMFEQTPGQAKRWLVRSLLVVPIALLLHVLLAPELRWIGGALGIDPTWLHLILGWTYLTPAWASLTAWLSVPSRAPVRAPVARGAAAAATASFLLTLACLAGLMAVGVWGIYNKWQVPTFVWLPLAAAWLLASSVGALYGSGSVPGLERRDLLALLRRVGAAFLTFQYVCFAWIFFAAANFSLAREILAKIAHFFVHCGEYVLDLMRGLEPLASAAASTSDAIAAPYPELLAGNLSTLLVMALVLAAVAHLIARQTYEWIALRFIQLTPIYKAAVLVALAMVLRELGKDKPAAFIYNQF